MALNENPTAVALAGRVLVDAVGFGCFVLVFSHLMDGRIGVGEGVGYFIGGLVYAIPMVYGARIKRWIGNL